MKTRKLVKLGSSLVVSLPKEWVKLTGVTESDSLYVQTSENNVIYSAPSSSGSKNKYEIHIDTLSDDDMRIMIYSAYIRNYHTITLSGSTLRNRLPKIREIFRNLVAIEIMDQLPNSLTATEMLDKAKNTSSQIIKTMDQLIRAQMIYIIDSMQGNPDEEKMIPKTDLDVNRLYILAQRVLFGADTQNPMTLINFKLVSLLERIADELRKFRKNKSPQVIPYLQKILSIYSNSLNCYYADKLEKTLELIQEINVIENEIIDKISTVKIIPRYQILRAIENILGNVKEICYLIVNKHT